MKSILITCAIALLIAPVWADVDNEGTYLKFFSPKLAWKLSFPKEGWELGQEKRRPDGDGFYYMATNSKQDLNFSVYIDKTDQCSSGESCRSVSWSGRSIPYKNAKDVKQFDKNGFAVVQFYLEFDGVPFKQQNLLAHAYKDGYWIDIHISKMTDMNPDPTSMISFLESIAIQ